MIVNTKKYAIATNSFPLKFSSKTVGEMTDNFNECWLTSNKEEAEKELSYFDEPFAYNIIEVEVTYRF